MNSERFVNYYVNQAGAGSLNGFVGAPVIYGRGLGAVLGRAFRFVLPFLKQGANIVKPHLKSAAKGIAADVVGTVTNRLMNQNAQRQEGSGLPRLARRKGKRPARALSDHVPRKKRKTVAKLQRKVKSQLGSGNIF